MTSANGDRDMTVQVIHPVNFFRTLRGRWLRGAIALSSVLLLTSACSVPPPSPDPDVDQAQSLPALDESASKDLEIDRTTFPSADEIRTFLEQGSVEDSAQCPSKTASTQDAIALTKVAYFETTNYWVGICSRDTGELEYYGRKRDNPELDLTLSASATGDRPQEFVAQNGNTRYQINPTELVVTQNGVPIIREPVIRSSAD